MVIGITINNILRDHITKLEGVYFAMTGNEPIKPVNPYELEKHFPASGSTAELFEFKPETKEDLDQEIELAEFTEGEEEFDVMQLCYFDGSFEVFGSAEQPYQGMIGKISEISRASQHKIILTNLESPRSMAATLFFLSKNFFDMKEIFFPDSKEELWEKFDVLITDDPRILAIKPEGKKSIKIENEFNKTVDSDVTVPTIKELVEDFDNIINKL